MDNRIGAQLYTLREFCKTTEDFRCSMEKVKKIGYKHVQVSGIGPIAAYDVKKICDDNGLEISCTHRPLENYINDIEKEIQYHKILNCDIAGLGYMPEEYRHHDALMQLIEQLNAVHARFAEEGITFAYHNHAFEFTKVNGKYIMDYLIEYGKFSFIVDTYWLAYAGINPAKYIEKLGKRAICVHFKDLAIMNADDIVMAEVGSGNLDWDDIFSACKAAGVRWALVEQDICQRDPFDCMETSFSYLQNKGFE